MIVICFFGCPYLWDKDALFYIKKKQMLLGRRRWDLLHQEHKGNDQVGLGMKLIGNYN